MKPKKLHSEFDDFPPGVPGEEPSRGRFLIVNADDFGRSRSVSKGICAAHLSGVVTSTSVMVNLPSALQDLEQAEADCPDLGFGIHLNLTHGQPVSAPEKLPSLLTAAGTFPNVQTRVHSLDSLSAEEVKREWRAQIERGLSSGVHLDHLDSHHHIAALHPELWTLLLELAAEYFLAVRNPCPSSEPSPSILEHIPPRHQTTPCGPALEFLHGSGVQAPDTFLTSFYGPKATFTHLIELLANLQPGIHELMTHPGYIDQELVQQSSYVAGREQELAILTDVRLRVALAQGSFSLLRFRDIPGQ